MSKILLRSRSRQVLMSSCGSVHALLIFICRWYYPQCKSPMAWLRSSTHYMKPHPTSSSPQPPLTRPPHLPGPHSTHAVVFFWNIQYVSMSLKTFLERSIFNRQNTCSRNYYWWTFHNQRHRLVLFTIKGVQFVFLFCNNKWNKRRVDDLGSIGVQSLDPASPASNL